MPEMEKETLLNPENGPKSPSVAHQTDIGLKAIQIASSLPEMNNTEDSDSKGARTKHSLDHKIDRFLSPSPISRSMEGHGIESEEEASRSTEDSQTVEEWNREVSIRPQTAPVMDDLTEEEKMDEMRTKSVPLSFSTSEPKFDLDDQTESKCNDIVQRSESGLAWHPHVYAKPPNQPTPHSINDILGLSRTRLDSGSNGQFYKEENSRNSFQRMGSSTSLSESSDSEEQSRGGDQPLNLCLSKSRSDSPGDKKRQLKPSRKGE